MCVAISKFEALCSFQKAFSIVENCRNCPELVAVVGEETVKMLAEAAELGPAKPPQSPMTPASDSSSPSGRSFVEEGDSKRAGAVKEALKVLFSNLMSADTAVVEKQVEALATRIERTNPMLRTPMDELAARIYEQYPKDVGVFCVYLLNYKELQPGEAIYLGANEPHAYIAGECAEAMATSDNVVRAGLTPKHRDVATLTSMLTYYDGLPHFVTPTQLGTNAFRYVTPSTEFLIDRVNIRASGQVATLPAAPGVSIIIFTSGGGSLEEIPENSAGAAGLMHSVTAGNIFMVCPGTFLRMQAKGGELQAFRCCAKYELQD